MAAAARARDAAREALHWSSSTDSRALSAPAVGRSGGGWWRTSARRRPRVLLLDEPLGALDLKLREEMQEELKSLQRKRHHLRLPCMTRRSACHGRSAGNLPFGADRPDRRAGRGLSGRAPIRRRLRRLGQCPAADLCGRGRRSGEVDEPAAGEDPRDRSGAVGGE